MKKLSILAVALISNLAFAHEDVAKIKSVEPEYATVSRPIEVCRDELVQDTVYPQHAQGEKNYAGAIIGGIAGGILGNQVGKGNGNKVATAAGAVAGAFIGDSMANSDSNLHANHQPQIITRKVRNCRMEETTEREITGYRVEYVYHGEHLSYVARDKPVGNKLRVNVHVEPIID